MSFKKSHNKRKLNGVDGETMDDVEEKNLDDVEEKNPDHDDVKRKRCDGVEETNVERIKEMILDAVKEDMPDIYKEEMSDHEKSHNKRKLDGVDGEKIDDVEGGKRDDVEEKNPDHDDVKRKKPDDVEGKRCDGVEGKNVEEMILDAVKEDMPDIYEEEMSEGWVMITWRTSVSTGMNTSQSGLCQQDVKPALNTMATSTTGLDSYTVAPSTTDTDLQVKKTQVEHSSRKRKSFRPCIPEILYNDERLSKVLASLVTKCYCPKFKPFSPYDKLRASHKIFAPCIISTRIGSDLNAMWAKITEIHQKVILLVFHPKAQHNCKLPIATRHLLHENEDKCEAVIDVLFWRGEVYDCDINTQAVHDLERLLYV